MTRLLLLRIDFIFGPEYNFPGNCYSERIVQDPAVLRSMAKVSTHYKYTFNNEPSGT